MEKKTYTSGEIAKIYHVSIRTVQYYDYEHIVKPSHLDESGRRQYSIEDLQHFQLFCYIRIWVCHQKRFVRFFKRIIIIIC